MALRAAGFVHHVLEHSIMYMYTLSASHSSRVDNVQTPKSCLPKFAKKSQVRQSTSLHPAKAQADAEAMTAW
jgi:hypothetical protein